MEKVKIFPAYGNLDKLEGDINSWLENDPRPEVISFSLTYKGDGQTGNGFAVIFLYRVPNTEGT